MVDEKDILLKNEMFSPSCCFKPVWLFLPWNTKGEFKYDNFLVITQNVDLKLSNFKRDVKAPQK